VLTAGLVLAIVTALWLTSSKQTLTTQTVTTTVTTISSTTTTSTSTTSTSTTTTTTTGICRSGFTETPSVTCVDLLSDFNNCGSIGFVCSSNYTMCSGGICKTAPIIKLSGAIPISAWAGVNTDDNIQSVTLSVNITLYNYSTNSVTVSSNGLLCLDSCTNAYSNGNLPTTIVGGPTAFAFWDDLIIYGSTGQMVYYSTTGTAPNRITGFEYYASPISIPAQYYHFQILFYENLPNIVKYVYFEIYA
ncbi:unnamed protein product, partial [Adineta steineri]